MKQGIYLMLGIIILLLTPLRILAPFMFFILAGHFYGLYKQKKAKQ